jgi:hypothetical protein
VKLDKFIDPGQLAEDIQYSDANISAAYSSQAPHFSFYAVHSAGALRQADRAKLGLEILEAKLDKEVRETFESEGTKITEGAVLSAIKRDSRHQKASMDVVETRHIAALCKAAVDSFNHRRDMLIQVGADIRKDMAGSMRMSGASSTDTIASAKEAHERRS